MRPSGHVTIAFVLLLILPPLAHAVDTAPVLVERSRTPEAVANVGSPAVASFELFNLNPTSDFYVSVLSTGPAGWTTSAEPNKFFLAPRETRLVNVTFDPATTPRRAETFTVTFSIVDSKTGNVVKVAETVEVASGAPPLVLDLVPNPLPSPLSNEYGTFVLDMAFWALIGIAAIFGSDAVVRASTTRASNAVTREIVVKLRKPVFYLVVLYGLGRSLDVLPRNAFVEFVNNTVVAIGVGLFGLYVVYKILDAALFYYQQEVAPRTETKIDDVLVPVIRKVGIVVLWVVGIIIALKNLGWDPTIIFAGAGVAGLVVAFAAQDTFSNLFSGVFLMLDQPFTEGDDIQLESGESARVENIGLRTTRLYNYSTHETITVPNNQLATKRIINHTGPDRRYWLTIDVGAAYAADPRKVEAALIDVAKRNARVLKEPGWEPKVRIKTFGDSQIDYQLRVGIGDFRDRGDVGSEVRFAIKQRFDEDGIDIPFPQRTIWLHQAPP